MGESLSGPDFTGPGEFDMLYQCIVSGQIPPDRCMELLQDRRFSRYYHQRRGAATVAPGTGEVDGTRLV